MIIFFEKRVLKNCLPSATEEFLWQALNSIAFYGTERFKNLQLSCSNQLPRKAKCTPGLSGQPGLSGIARLMRCGFFDLFDTFQLFEVTGLLSEYVNQSNAVRINFA